MLRVLYNVHLEKKLLEVHNDVTFIIHINLTDKGQIIKDNYKEDQLHLSIRGFLVFGIIYIDLYWNP